MILDDLDTAPGGFLLISEAGTIMDLNSTLLKMLDYPEKELLKGKNFGVIFSLADRIFHQTHFLPLLQMQGHADEIFFRLKTREGNNIPVICNAVRKLRNSEPTIHCIFISAVQRSKYEQEILSARKEAQEALTHNSALVAAKGELEEKTLQLDLKLAELKKVNDDLLQFAKVISHDVQEPIRKIAVFTDKVSRDAQHQLADSIISQFHKINKECINLRQLAATLERFISLNIHSEETAHTDLNEIIRIAFQTAMGNEVSSELHFITGQLPVLVGLQRQLEMLFYNIFSNSREYAAPGLSIRISVEHVIFQQNLYQQSKDAYHYADFLRITLRDNGPGFNAKPDVNYFAIQKKTTVNGFGLSFGLAFASKVVTNHHGSIGLESAVGSGTAVIITLPLNRNLEK